MEIIIMWINKGAAIKCNRKNNELLSFAELKMCVKAKI